MKLQGLAKVSISIACFATIVVIGKHVHDTSSTNNANYNYRSVMQGTASAQVLQVAFHLAGHLTGVKVNQYNPADPAIQDVVSYWNNNCTGACTTYLNPLQCAMYVQTVFAMAGHPLPLGNGVDYWAGAATLAGLKQQGWQPIPDGTGLPHPGDLAMWSYQQFGHIAIVVAVQPPVGNTNGSVTFVEANAPANVTGQVDNNGHIVSFSQPGTLVPTLPMPGTLSVPLYQLPITPQYHVLPTWGTFLGYQHNPAYDHILGLTNPGMPATLPNSQYVQMAKDAAAASGIDEIYFVRQINQESGFNPNARSKAGAVGIAQFLPDTAAHLGINPSDPKSALYGAARLMAGYVNQYLSQDMTTLEKDRAAAYQRAYMKALAAYNAGGGNLDRALRLYPGPGATPSQDSWYLHLPDIGLSETYNYIRNIMGL